ncbi:acyltransferase [Flavobacterium algicola]|uniref:acyltransferase n=1 Tax=Flavobacterium algicola TaxID=556529 RepID=UPI001EFDB78D|nr:acyltransferase [Flavobacterium algicola]MCG9793514.1 acyltransferase [Flavobacterium algicola]
MVLPNNTIIGRIVCDWPSKIKIGQYCEIQDETYFKFKNPFDMENYVSIGDRTFIGRNCEFNCNLQIIIGSDVLIGSNSVFVDNNHQIDKNICINLQPIKTALITLKNDIWIGSNCTILMGVTINDGAVVAAGSVVTKNIPSNEIWGGIPAKKIKDRV